MRMPSNHPVGVRATVPVAGTPALMVFPSASDTITEGIVMLGSVPPMVPGSPGALLTTMTATAPASWGLFAFWTKVHPPRSTSATAPAGKPISVWQPSVVVPLPSSTSTMSPETPSSVGAGPNAAPLAGYWPAAGDGGSTITALGCAFGPHGGSVIGASTERNINPFHTETSCCWPLHSTLASCAGASGSETSQIVNPR